MRAIFALVGLLLLSMGRARVDPEKAKKAVEAVRSGNMSLRVAAEAYGLTRTALHDRVTKKVAIDARVGPGTVLSKEEEDSIEDVLIYASRHFLLLGRKQLKDAVRNICSDGRKVPWDPDKGPGDSWLEGFMARHPGLSERATHIYEANRINEDDDQRLQAFYETWEAYLAETKLTPDRIVNTDETSELGQGLRCQWCQHRLLWICRRGTSSAPMCHNQAEFCCCCGKKKNCSCSAYLSGLFLPVACSTQRCT